MTQPTLFCFGLGYTAELLARQLLQEGWKVRGTTRNAERLQALELLGIEATLFNPPSQPLASPGDALAGVTHIVHSIPPLENGDAVWPDYASHITALNQLQWVGYLSTTGVYGDSGGEWVDETSPTNPTTARAQRRKNAEQSWLEAHATQGVPTHIFRLAGIYGPGRNALRELKAGTARRIEKPGQVFSRIHVEDIVQALNASMHKPTPGEMYNICDDEPAAQREVVEYAAELLGMEPPPLQQFQEAELSPMARSFYAANRRVSNKKTKQAFEIEWKYPSYREGLQALASSLQNK